ncbi:MAG: hypothetical protein LBR08_09980 [Bacteroidales bacterium]|jgi:hypothetical protein|nr:hypothetical protein [Bacteroidales bacterium]
MKKFFTFLFVCTLAGATCLQAQEMQKNTSLLSASAGFLPGVGAGISYDYGLIDTWGPGVFTVGGYIGYTHLGKSYYGDNRFFKDVRYFISPRVTYRYTINNTFEVYGTFMLGYYVGTTATINAYKALPAITAGYRYFLTDKISLFAETGFNITILNAGFNLSF